MAEEIVWRLVAEVERDHQQLRVEETVPESVRVDIATVESCHQNAAKLGYTLLLTSTGDCVATPIDEDIDDEMGEEGTILHVPLGLVDSRDALAFVDNPTRSDCLLLVNGTAFYAHRALLSRRSTYFSAMFCSVFQETTMKCVRLSCTPCGSFRFILRFLYSGLVDEAELFRPEDRICRVLRNADYLGIDKLYTLALCKLSEVAVWRRAFEQDAGQMQHLLSFDFLELLLQKAPSSTEKMELIGRAVNLKSWDISRDTHVHANLSRLCVVHNIFVDLSAKLLKSWSNSEYCQKVIQLVPVADIIEMVVKKQAMVLEKMEFEMKNQVSCRSCGLRSNLHALRTTPCTTVSHPGKYRKGYNHGWTCCSKPYKKDQGCVSSTEDRHQILMSQGWNDGVDFRTLTSP